MAFNPLTGHQDACRLSQEELVAIASSAAEKLLADLDRAKRLTGGWQNEGLAQLLVNHVMSECLCRLSETECWGRANQLPSSAFWKTAGEVLTVGWLQLRAREKPAGYAGDHEILARMYHQHSCEDPLGRLFDRYFLSLAAPQAVRARLMHVAETLAARAVTHDGDEYRAVSVGSGPGIDIATALAAMPADCRKKTRVTLLDLDTAALDDASTRILEYVSESALQCRQENLFRLASKKVPAVEPASANLVICTGLFDYFRDDVAADMLRFFWQSLAQGGQMLVGNFAPHNPTRAYMEWVGNWYLTYRTADQLRQLVEQAGIPPQQCSIRTDRTGVDLFLVAEKA